MVGRGGRKEGGFRGRMRGEGGAKYLNLQQVTFFSLIQASRQILPILTFESSFLASIQVFLGNSVILLLKSKYFLDI